MRNIAGKTASLARILASYDQQAASGGASTVPAWLSRRRYSAEGQYESNFCPVTAYPPPNALQQMPLANDNLLPTVCALQTCPDPLHGAPHCFSTGKLIVSAMRTRDTKGEEFYKFGKADPYLNIRFGGKYYGREGQTTVHWDAGSTPVWNQTFAFHIKQPNCEFNTLQVSLMNKNSHLRKDNLLGELSLLNMGAYLSSHGNSVSDRWYPMFGMDGKERGEILLSFDFIRRSEADLLSSDCLELVMGCSSHARNNNGESNMHADYQTKNIVRHVKAVIGVARLML